MKNLNQIFKDWSVFNRELKNIAEDLQGAVIDYSEISKVSKDEITIEVLYDNNFNAIVPEINEEMATTIIDYTLDSYLDKIGISKYYFEIINYNELQDGDGFKGIYGFIITFKIMYEMN